MALLVAAPGRGKVGRQLRGLAAEDLASALRVTSEVAVDGLRLRGLKRDSAQLDHEGPSEDECDVGGGTATGS